jgi:hypothetical protein
MFFLDPSGNALEFKSLKDIARQLFATCWLRLNCETEQLMESSLPASALLLL